MRGSRILDAVRLHRQGFPKFMSHQEFTRRFHLLASSVTVEDNQEKIAVEEMVQIMDLDPATYRIGLNKVRSFKLFSYVNMLSWKEHKATRNM